MRRISRGGRQGVTLVEILIVVTLISILAGMACLVFGGSGDKAEAARIVADLDAVKSAMISYALRHPSRSGDPLSGWSAPSSVRASLDEYMDRPIPYNMKVEYPNGTVTVAFDNFNASDTLAGALNDVIAGRPEYEGKYSGGGYTLSVRVR
jgi:prepilin-type N-terminal cleavage/methylation domain-containing protein